MTSGAIRLSIALVAITLLAACNRGGGEVKVVDGRITIPPPGMRMSAGYFTIDNGTGKDIEVKQLSSEAFDSVEMHETRTVDGVSSMHQLQTLSVPAGKSVSFEPGGKHLMLFGPRAALNPGQTVTIGFTVASADGQETKLPVTFHAGDPGAAHAH